MKSSGERKSLHTEYQKLIETHQKFTVQMKEIEQVKLNGLIEQVERINKMYDAYEKSYTQYQYLKEITEDSIFQSYQAEIRQDHN